MLFILHFLIMLPVIVYRRNKFREHEMWKCLITDVYKMFGLCSVLSLGYCIPKLAHYYIYDNPDIDSLILTIFCIVVWDTAVYVAYICLALFFAFIWRRGSDLKLLWWLGLEARYSRVSDFWEQDEDLDDSILMCEDDEPNN